MTTKITADNISSLSNMGITWNAVTVADGSTTLSPSAGNGYFLDTNTGVIEVFLPTSPSRGDTIILIDYAGTFATNQVIVNTGTQNLDSTTTRQYKLTTNDTIAEFVYVDSDKGWITKINQAAGSTPSGAFSDGVYNKDPGFTAATGGTVTTSGDFKIHSFTGDGTFCVSFAGVESGGAGGPAVADYVVVAGGGGAGGDGAGGGGAGGYREAKSCAAGSYTASPLASCTGITLTTTSFPITVGAGGAGATCGAGSQGSNSIFSTITSTGGGFGGAGSAPGTQGGDGGSGGGARTNSNFPNGGSGNTPPVSPAQGRDGGGNAPGNMKGGGGGGATAEGVDGPTGPMAGGAGATNHITGSPVTRAGGGGGGFNGTTQDGGPGGSGGGGAGGGNGPGPAVAGDAGSANTGGGGGGSGGGNPGRSGGAGGKGVVIIRYKFQ